MEHEVSLTRKNRRNRLPLYLTDSRVERYFGEAQLDNRPTAQVWSGSELISNDAGRGAAHNSTLLGCNHIGKLFLANLRHPQNDRRCVQVTIRPQQGSVHEKCIVDAHQAMCSMHMAEDMQSWLQTSNGFQ